MFQGFEECPKALKIDFFDRGGLRKRAYSLECVMAVQGHPRSLVLVPIEIAYATSY